jgi:hypothetical protein
MPLTELVYCVTIAFTNLLTFKGDFSFGKNHKSQGAKSGLYECWQTWVMRCFAKRACMRAVEWAGALMQIRSLRHCECDGLTVHNLSQRRLTADWLAPQESDCSRMHNKVFSDWLPSYIKAMQPVLEIFKMAGYFPYSPRTCVFGWCVDYKLIQF